MNLKKNTDSHGNYYEINEIKNSLTTPSGNIQLIKLPINPPTAAPKKSPIRIKEIFLLVMD